MRVLKLRLSMLLVLVAAVAVISAWGVYAWRRHLADDSGQFYSHEESAAFQAFHEAVAIAAAVEAERKAAEGGADAPQWEQKAAMARQRAALAAKAKREYQWRASLKHRRW